MDTLRTATRPVKTCTGHTLYEHAGHLTLEIISGRVNKWYRLTPVASDFGAAFRLEGGCGDKLAGGEASYDVLLDGDATSCTCPGFAFTGGCKHASALLALQSEGRI
jgi:SWIM zinc finger